MVRGMDYSNVCGIEFSPELAAKMRNNSIVVKVLSNLTRNNVVKFETDNSPVSFEAIELLKEASLQTRDFLLFSETDYSGNDLEHGPHYLINKEMESTEIFQEEQL